MIKGIIFDFDGLICDSETPELKAWQQLFAHYKKTFPFQEYLKSIGATFIDNTPILMLKKMLNGAIDIDQVMSEFISIKRNMVEHEPLCPGVLAYLQQAKKAELIIGLASSSPREWVFHHTKRLGVFHFFDCIRTSDDVCLAKPDPELYVRTLECMQLQPHEAVALEDSPNGVKAAQLAGLKVVAVPNSVTRIFDFSDADLVQNSLSDIPLMDLFAKIV